MLTHISEIVLADICDDCRREHCAYMVLPEVWESARLKQDQPCCLKCLQKRLGRDLSPEDFDFYSPCNLFLPGTIEKRALFSMVRDMVADGTSYRKRRLVVDSVLKLRRKHPEGLTMRQVTDWALAEFGIKFSSEQP